MTFLEATVAGVVQGTTEFLPISSSGHLVLLHALFGFKEPTLLFDLYLHLGTTIAVCVCFGKEILKYLSKERKVLGYLFLSTLATAMIGLPFEKMFESFFMNPQVVGLGFLMTSGVLLVGERFGGKKEEALSGKKAFLIGLGQGLAMVPGISRSGVTIVAGLLLGLKSAFAVQYSFLLLIPTVLGAFIVKLLRGKELDSVIFPFVGEKGFVFGTGMLVAALFGMVSIPVVSRMVEKRKLSLFSVYLVGLGLVTLFAFR